MGCEGVVVFLTVGEHGCAEPPVVVYYKEGGELFGEVDAGCGGRAERAVGSEIGGVRFFEV